MNSLRDLRDCATALAAGRVQAMTLAESCLARIEDPAGEGARAFIAVDRHRVLAAAAEADARRARGAALSAFDGIPISIKDLFDVAGETTRAGSILLREAPPARADAVAIARLRRAGLVFIGRTNMTEFAYGGHGINAHYGTPANPWDRESRRIPGGSTSGGAVSVTDGMAVATIGSDTGGSVRLPAALCGLVGYKPTQARVSLAGAFPLSTTRDSIGPLGHTAACCIALDRIMAGLPPDLPEPVPLKSCRFGVPTTVLLDDLMPEVAHAFEQALTVLQQAGAAVERFEFPVVQREIDGSRKVNFSAVEAYALHRERIAQHPEKFDPRVLKRLLLGADMRAADYYELLQLRQRLIAEADAASQGFDALLTPTSAMIAPRIDEMLADDDAFARINLRLLRNCMPFNVLDRPAWSLPCHTPGTAPVGLMVIGARGGDDRLQAVGLAIEAALTARR